MDIPTKKLKNGFEMPVFGLGTWTMGGREDNVHDSTNDDARDIAAIKTAIDLGVTHIDTAESYAGGYAEQLVAQAIKDYDRSKLFLVSKVKFDGLTYQGVKTALAGSLKRLGTTYLDLYLMHRYPGSDQSLKDSLKAMAELKERGLIKNIGISNFTTKHTKQAVEWSKHPIVATQVHYSLRFREPEADGLLDFCQKNDIILIAWRPLGMGSARRGRTEPEQEPIILELAKKYSKTPAQIALNWLTLQPNIVTLTKTTNVEHLKENLGFIGWHMEPEDAERLRKEFPDQQNISDVVPLG
jgi:diketogulonate reductase-like aldo/keto reductase